VRTWNRYIDSSDACTKSLLYVVLEQAKLRLRDGTILLMALAPRPEFWTNFDGEKSSNAPAQLDKVVWTFVSQSVPAKNTNRDVVEQIAKEADIPIESLCGALSQPIYTRAQVIFGFAGDEIDKVARGYDRMRWWVSSMGLNMAIDNLAKSHNERIVEFVKSAADAQLLGSHQMTPPLAEFKTARRGRRPAAARRNAIRTAVNKYGDEWRDYLIEIFKKLDAEEIPLGDFGRKKLDLGDDQRAAVLRWEDLDLAAGDDRRKIIDRLRKYRDPRT
jgi:hypothetical protein